MTPREAFTEFAEIERRFGTDDSPLFKVLHALIDQGERLENKVNGQAIRLAMLTGEQSDMPTMPKLEKAATAEPIDGAVSAEADTDPAIPIKKRRTWGESSCRVGASITNSLRARGRSVCCDRARRSLPSSAGPRSRSPSDGHRDETEHAGSDHCPVQRVPDHPVRGAMLASLFAFM